MPTKIRQYKKSEQLLKKALNLIPLGAQTFSKSMIQFPLGVSPYYLDSGLGSHVWDVDGNEYIDFVNGLLSVLLGYRDSDIDAVVLEQIQRGVSFSLSHALEIEVAEQIVAMVPSAEMVRFGKNGSDATSGAVRLARAYTGREHIVVCGYHGWQDWYIGSTTRNLGVPKSTQALTHRFSYNDITSLEEIFAHHIDQIAAVIMEPMYAIFPQNNFLQQVKELTHRNGALLIFDEIVTGFRFAKGGAQEYFGVIPDLTTLGKGMGNGYPISAIAGRRDVMALMEDIFYSFTFGGETLSLAATKATLNKINTQPVIKTMEAKGLKIIEGVKSLIKSHDLEVVLDITGHPSLSMIIFKDAGNYTLWDIKTLYIQEMLACGILTLGTHNISYAHTDTDINVLLSTYDDVFGLIKKSIYGKTLHSELRCEPLKPLFKIR